MWEAVNIATVCETIIDCVNKTAPVVDYETPYKMIRTTNVRDGWVLTEAVRYVAQETYETWTRRQVPRRNDVILTREAPLGEAGIVRTDDSIFLGQRLVSYRTDPTKLDPHFLLYSFLSREMKAQILALGSGSTVAHMRVPDAQKLSIRLPPLPTQRRIAGILSAYDDLIENNTKRIEILEEMARALYREWFVHFRFPGHEKVKFVDSPLGQIPEGWEVVRIDECCLSVSYGYTAKASSDADGPLFLRITDIVKTTIDWGSVPRCPINTSKIEKYSLTAGDVVAARTGATAGWAKQVRKRHPLAVYASYLVRFRPDSPSTGSWLGILMESEEYKNFIIQHRSGSAQPQANARVLGSYLVARPPKQQAATFGELVDPLRDLAELLNFENRVLRETRDLLLPRLISGELNVNTLNLPEPP